MDASIENNVKRRRLNDDNNIKNSFSSKPIEFLYLKEQFADVHFVFEASNEQIPAHKCILVKSPVFKEMLEVKIEDDTFKIEDAHADGFKEFLQFFYLEEVKLSMDHIESVMYLCRKYQIHECLEICSSVFLMENLSVEEMFFGYKLAIEYNQNDLKEFCQQTMFMNADEVLESEAFLNCDWNVLMEMVKSDALSCREIVLLEACINWARNACKREKLIDNQENIRAKLGDAIYEIRFKGMPMTEFAIYLKNFHNPYNLNELEDIARLIGQANITSAPARLKPFDSIPWNDTDKLECGRWIYSIADYNVPNTTTAIFSSDKSLIFGEFDVNLKPFECSIYCEILLEDMDGPKTVDIFAKTLIIEKGSDTSIVLPKRVIIEEYTKYKIQINFWSSDFQLKTDGTLKEEIELENGAVITFHPDVSSDFNIIEKGVITALYFNEFNL